MKEYFQFKILSIGLAIFSMFFGAGNLMYPIKAGMDVGSSKFTLGIFGFLLTSIILPLFGLVGMILFEGDYKKFLFRLGKIPGYFLLISCMLILGPLIAMPRIITLSYTMMSPFLPDIISLLVFIFLFLGITFVFTYRENKIVDLLGKFISPLLVISLMIIIIKGLIMTGSPVVNSNTALSIFKQNIWRGYETLDLISAIFFSSIILHILKMSHENQSNKRLAFLGFQAGMLGLAVLGIVYIGLGLIGMLHGYGFESANPGELFKEISFKILGPNGAIIISTAVFMACLSTAIALAAVVSEFLQLELCKNKISFPTSLAIMLISCIPLSLYGLDIVLNLTAGPITYIGYPILIALTLLNICYKLFGFKSVKIPVLIVALLALISYLGFI